MRYALLVAALSSAIAADPDPREIVRRSVETFDGRNAELALNYNFLERVETRRLDGDGTVKSVSLKTHDVVMIEGSPYRRLVAIDDKPLSAEERRDQMANLKRSIEERRHETPAEREKRLADFEKRRTKYLKAIREIPDAFDFRLAGEETIDSRPAYVIEATPREGYRPVDRYSKLFTQLKGRLWVNKADHHWVRVEAELTDTVSFAWILVRIGKGARVKIEQTRVNDEVWLPRRMWFVVSLRIGLIKGYHVEQETTYREYRKFQADSHIVSMREVQ